MIDTETDIKTAMEARNGRLTVYREQDVAPILDHNKRMQADGAGGWRRTGRSIRRKVAEIPNIVIEKWLTEGFNFFRATENEIRKKLDEPDYSYLKTITGKLGNRSRHM